MKDIQDARIDLLIPPEIEYLKTLEPPINLHLSEGLTLCWLASLAEENIVEIGSYMGKSACFMAAGSKLGNRIPVHCIEPWDMRDPELDKRSDEKFNLFGKSHIRNRFNQQTKPFKELIIPIQGYSVKVAQTWGKSIDLLFIDGNHNCVYEDYEAWYPHISSKGIIAFHDIIFPHVWKAIQQIKELQTLTNWIIISRLIYAVKIGGA